MNDCWQVRVCYYYPSESYKDTLEMDVRTCNEESVAVWLLNKIIRDEWTTTISDGDNEVLLADRKGFASCPDSPKHSEVYYSKDGKTAWAFFPDGHGYKGEVVNLGKDK